MTDQHIYGHTKSGELITDEMIERFAEEAERGYEPGQLKGRRRGPGRPPLGDAAKSVESVRLEPELRDEVWPSPRRPDTWSCSLQVTASAA